MSGKIHLIIPDAHAHPDEDNTRFDWIGKLILDLRPDVVVNIGDLWDMPSLSGHSAKKEMESKRYQQDIEVGVEALDRINAPTRKAKKKRPRMVFTIGNHEDRIDRITSQQPILLGKIGMSDLQLEEHGWEVHDFLTPVVIGDIAYCHFFVTGVMGRPISGENIARSLLNKQHMSVTQGHNHLLDYALGVRADGRRIQGLTCGVFQDYKTKWNNNQSEALWWPGVVIKRDVDNGTYDPEFVSIRRLEREYG